MQAIQNFFNEIFYFSTLSLQSPGHLPLTVHLSADERHFRDSGRAACSKHTGPSGSSWLIITDNNNYTNRYVLCIYCPSCQETQSQIWCSIIEIFSSRVPLKFISLPPVSRRAIEGSIQNNSFLIDFQGMIQLPARQLQARCLFYFVFTILINLLNCIFIYLLIQKYWIIYFTLITCHASS